MERRLNNVEEEIKTLAINLNSYSVENNKYIEETQAYFNDVSEQLWELKNNTVSLKSDIATLKGNHLAHLKADLDNVAVGVKWLKWTIGIGLAFIALILSVLAVVVGVGMAL